MKFSKPLEFVLGVIGVLIAAAFVAPLLTGFIPYEFSRVLSRTVMVLFLIWVGVFIFRHGGLRVKEYGLIWNERTRHHLWIAFLVSFLTLSAMIALQLPFGVRSWQFTFHETVWPWKILKYFFSALTIGLIEEFIFRGLLFKTLRTRTRLLPAFVTTNLIYSLSHFLRFSGEEVAEPTFLSSFQVYGAVFEPFMRLGEIWPNAIGLFLFGCVLSYVFIHSGSLLFPIGLHAGAVFFLKMDQWFIQVNSETYKIWFGGSDLQSCVMGWIFMCVMGVISYQILKNKNFGR